MQEIKERTNRADVQGPQLSPTSDDGGIVIRNLTKKFGDAYAVEDVTFTIREGELLVFLGPSGCGKTTTLNLLAGLEEADSGAIYFGKRRMTEVQPEDRDISMVFQNIGLYPHLDVRENISFALRLWKVSRGEIDRRIEEMTRLLGIEGLLDRRLHQLSGGERQRVAIAKALVKRPTLFLLDEPFSSLDADLRRQFRSELVRIHRNLQTTMVFVTHDQEEAMTIADRIMLMRDGKVVQLGGPLEIYYQPANLWSAQFIGTHPINLIECQLQTDAEQAFLFGGSETTIPLDAAFLERIRSKTQENEVLLGIRPEFVMLQRFDPVAPGAKAEVLDKEILGLNTLYHLLLNTHEIRAVQPSTHQFDKGEIVSLSFLWPNVFVFDKSSGECILSTESFGKR